MWNKRKDSTGEFETRLVGVTFDGRPERLEKCSIGERIYLIREMNNKFDKKAILVVNQDGDSLGHISAEMVELLSSFADNRKGL